MSRKKAPPPDPAQQSLAYAQADATRENIAMQREMWNRALGLQEKDSERAEEQYQFNRGLQTEAADRDRFFFDRYKNTAMRNEDEFFKLVDAYDTEDNRSQLAAQGMADVESGLAAARQGTAQAMARRGVDVGSARYAGAMTGMDLAAAAAKASAANTAREAARREGMDLRMVAAGLGNPLGASTSYMGASSGFGGTAMGMSGRGLDWTTGRTDAAARSAQAFGANANSAFDSINRYNMQRAQQGGGGIGSLVGGLAGSFFGPAGGQIGKSVGAVVAPKVAGWFGA